MLRHVWTGSNVSRRQQGTGEGGKIWHGLGACAIRSMLFPVPLSGYSQINEGLFLMVNSSFFLVNRCSINSLLQIQSIFD